MSDDLDARLKTIAANAVALREAGVTAVEIEGVGKFALSPHVEPQERPEDAPLETANAVDDPTTFGQKPGTRPPGRRRVETD